MKNIFFFDVIPSPSFSVHHGFREFFPLLVLFVEALELEGFHWYLFTSFRRKPYNFAFLLSQSLGKSLRPRFSLHGIIYSLPRPHRAGNILRSLRVSLLWRVRFNYCYGFVSFSKKEDPPPPSPSKDFVQRQSSFPFFPIDECANDPKSTFPFHLRVGNGAT